MIKYNSNTINDWYYNSSDIIKVYHNGAVCYYKIAENGSYKVCFAVVDDITQYTETEFEDVFDKATEKWYKLNNLNEYEEYGVYASGRTSCSAVSFTELTDIIAQSTTALTNHNITVTPAVGAFSKIRIDTTKSATTSSYCWVTFTPTPSGSEVLGINMSSIGTMNGYGNNKNYVTDANGSQTFAHWVDDNNTIVEIDIAALSNNQTSELYLLFYQENCNPAAFSFYIEPKRLPQGYTEVEYIRHSNDVRVQNVWSVPNDAVDGNIYTVDLLLDSTSQQGQSRFIGLFGWGSGHCQRTNRTAGDQTNAGYHCSDGWHGNDTIGNYYQEYDVKLRYRMTTSALTITNTQTSAVTTLDFTVNSGSATGGNFGVFSYTGSDSGAYQMRGNIYQIIIEGSDNTIKHQYIPCQRNSDSQYGLYDLIGEEFYYPTTITISGGEPVTPTDCVTTYEGKLTIDEEATSRLPQGYTEVEYIQNNTQGAYINTGLLLYDVTGNSFSISAKLKSQYESTWAGDGYYLQTIINSEDVSSPYYGFTFRYAYQTHVLGGGCNPSNSVVFSSIANTDGTSSLTINCNSTTVTSQVPLELFASYNGNYNTPYRFSNATIYSFQVTKNDTLVRDLVPAKRDSDDKYGLYDIVNDVFYLSPNNVDFSGGEPVIEPTKTYEYEWNGTDWVNVGEVSGSTYLEYLERDSSHNGYVPLGEYFQTNTRIQIDFQMTQAKGNAIIGDYGSNDSDDWRVFLNYDLQVNNWLVYDFTNSRNYYNTGDWSKRFNIEIGNYYIKDLDSGNYLINTTAKTSFSRPNQMYLFHMDGTQNTNNIDYGRIYSLKIWQNDVLVKDYIPWTDGNGNYGLYDNVSSSVTQSIGSMTGATSGSTEYPKYYSEKTEPLDDLTFSTLTEAQTYAYNNCVYDGMKATIDGKNYVFDSEDGWVEKMHSLPNVPFMLNYNAREYDASTKTLPKTEGQLRDSDAVCNYGYHIVDHSADGYITVTGNTRMVISGTPYFNRTNTLTGCTMTIVSKVKTTNVNESYSILTNRGDYGTMNWMWRYPSNGIFLHGSTTYNSPKYFTSTTEQPITASIRISYDDSVKQLLNDWTNNGSYNGAFQYGPAYSGNNAMFCDYTSINAEFWKGDFYWVYMSQEVLTDEQIQQVIDYNENL